VPNELQPARGGLQAIAVELIRGAAPQEAAELAWTLACGAAVADRTHVIHISDGVLRVQVPDAAWRAQLSDFAPRYLAAVNRLWPEGGVQRIEMVVR
jgi:predicted nucleic acid-binding Zn ribbon protein